MGRINGTGLRVTRRESLLLQIPVGSRPLSKLNPACASVTISRRGGWGGTILEILPIYFLLLLLLFFQINFLLVRKEEEERRQSYIIDCLVLCVYIFRDIRPLLSSLLKFRKIHVVMNAKGEGTRTKSFQEVNEPRSVKCG